MKSYPRMKVPPLLPSPLGSSNAISSEQTLPTTSRGLSGLLSCDLLAQLTAPIDPNCSAKGPSPSQTQNPLRPHMRWLNRSGGSEPAYPGA